MQAKPVATPPVPNVAMSVEERVTALLAEMTLAEKIGQMTLIEKNGLTPDDVREYFIGGVLSGGGGSPTRNSAESWREMTDGFQAAALETRLAIPILYGVDAVHGHGNMHGATVFPHNIGLGATRNADLVREIGRITAIETVATGVNWNYAPAVSVAQDVRWGRTYESFSSDTALVTALATAYLDGLQQGDLTAPTAILGTPKHYIADGGARYGTASANIWETDYLVDRGDTAIDEATLRAVHLPPYEAAIAAGARSIMASYSSWNGEKSHGSYAQLTELLKEELGFDGFIVSDWGAHEELADNSYDGLVLTINAGVDMVMVPRDFALFARVVNSAVENGDITTERIDDAVRRILRVKFEMGLFEQPYTDQTLLAMIGSDDHRAIARQAARESAVLLTNNDDVLPLNKETPLIFVAGEAADDIGLQSGGWTIDWQGRAGNITPGTTILDGIKATAQGRVQYNRHGRYDRITDDTGALAIADVGIVVLAEEPYAEGVGDSADLALPDLHLIERVRERSRHVVVIVLSGRPVMISEVVDSADAWVAAFLPGTEGDGISELLFGDAPFTGKLSFAWPRSIAEIDGEPLFPFGHGLTTR